jgi:hypothetical protein
MLIRAVSAAFRSPLTGFFVDGTTFKQGGFT